MQKSDTSLWLEPVLQYYGHDTSRGPGKIQCQFHDDEHPSASWDARGFKCHACGVWGDAVRLVKEQEGVDWREAYEIAAGIAGDEHEEVAEVPRPGGPLPGGSGILRGDSRGGKAWSGR